MRRSPYDELIYRVDSSGNKELVIALFIEVITRVVSNFYSEYYGLDFLEKKFRIL